MAKSLGDLLRVLHCCPLLIGRAGESEARDGSGVPLALMHAGRRECPGKLKPILNLPVLFATLVAIGSRRRRADTTLIPCFARHPLRNAGNGVAAALAAGTLFAKGHGDPLATRRGIIDNPTSDCLLNY